MYLENTKLKLCEKCFGTGHVHGGDEKSTRSKTCEDCHGIGFVRVPMTNADRIRAMSDEELAKNLYRFCDLEERVGYCKNLSECEKLLDTEDGIPEQRCICCLLEWLKQPAEVE